MEPLQNDSWSKINKFKWRGIITGWIGFSNLLRDLLREV
jgi:hypothetical protein